MSAVLAGGVRRASTGGDAGRGSLARSSDGFEERTRAMLVALLRQAARIEQTVMIAYPLRIADRARLSRRRGHLNRGGERDRRRGVFAGVVEVPPLRACGEDLWELAVHLSQWVADANGWVVFPLL